VCVVISAQLASLGLTNCANSRQQEALIQHVRIDTLSGGRSMCGVCEMAGVREEYARST